MPVVRFSEALFDAVTMLEVPLKESALPNLPFPAPAHAVLVSEPRLPSRTGRRWSTGALVEPVGGDEADCRRGGDRCDRLVGGRADVRSRVLGGHLVVVVARGEAVVRIARRRRLRDPVGRARREARGGRAVDVVARDADVVGRGGPGEHCLAGAAGGDERARRRRRGRVGDGGAGGVGDGADVSGGVFGGDLVEVAAGGHRGVGEAQAGRLADAVRGRRREAAGRCPPAATSTRSPPRTRGLGPVSNTASATVADTRRQHAGRGSSPRQRRPSGLTWTPRPTTSASRVQRPPRDHSGLHAERGEPDRAADDAEYTDSGCSRATTPTR